MQDILFHYQKIHPMNWVYLSSLLSIALYFKFSRLWSVRNADVVGLLLFAPSLVLIAYGSHPPVGVDAQPSIEFAGYIWLFVVGALFLVRMLMDSTMVRRPLLDPNLTVGGMVFLGVSLFVFLMANVVNSDPKVLDPKGEAIAAAQLEGDGEGDSKPSEEASGLQRYGPRSPFLAMLPEILTQTLFGREPDRPAGDSPIYNANRIVAAKVIVIVSHLAIVVGMILIGTFHFDNIRTGVAAAVLYLLMPYTAEMTGRVAHALPAALLVWSVVAYRRPIASGLLLGLAMGVIYYPLFLLPLWISFYWQRGLVRFLIGVTVAIGFSIGMVAIFASDLEAFVVGLRQMLGLASPRLNDLDGFWRVVNPIFRLPVIATFVALGCSFALWPAQKNLGTLLSGTAALMLGSQFWHANGGGLFMAWYLPLMLLTIFRPNLEDRVALSVLHGGWRRRRRSEPASSE